VSSKSCERIKQQICQELSKRQLSISHDRWHLERVLAFAEQLQAIYGGDIEVLTAAVLLHDLGRSDSNLHGRASVKKSVDEARMVLDVVDISRSKIEPVMRAISEHDQAELVPSTMEGKILKEADFLAGFGAWGILRIAMWAAETDQGVDQILDRLEKRMPKRLAGLEFSESAWRAEREMLFADLFLSRLKEPPLLEEQPRQGKYVVLEGISGSGKDTQADLLEQRLRDSGHKLLRVNEPAGKFQAARDRWGHQPLDPVIELFLLLADRYELMTQRVLPTLARGDTVLSVRSYLSTLVYQHQPLYDSASIRFMHQFVPPPDLVILYDVDVDIAYERCYGRAKGQIDAMGAHERKKALKAHRRRYLKLATHMTRLRFVTIDASRLPEQIAAETWEKIESQIL